MRRTRLTDTGPVWVIALVTVAGLPLTALIYYPAVLRTGKLDPMADSILIPIMDSVYLAAFATPIVAAVTWICLKTYDPTRPLFGWRKDRPVTSLLVSVAFLVPAALVTLSVLWTPFSEFAAQDWLWLPHQAACLAWCLLLRSAALSGR